MAAQNGEIERVDNHLGKTTIHVIQKRLKTGSGRKKGEGLKYKHQGSYKTRFGNLGGEEGSLMVWELYNYTNLWTLFLAVGNEHVEGVKKEDPHFQKVGRTGDLHENRDQTAK